MIEGPAVGSLEIRATRARRPTGISTKRPKQSMRGEWFRSGDRFERRTDGIYAYVGRDDDMVKVSGLWVSPVDIEESAGGAPGSV